MIRKLLNRYKSYSIAKKTLIILLAGSMVPLMIMETITCMIAASTLKRQTDILMESNMKLSQKGLWIIFPSMTALSCPSIQKTNMH